MLALSYASYARMVNVAWVNSVDAGRAVAAGALLGTLNFRASLPALSSDVDAEEPLSLDRALEMGRLAAPRNAAACFHALDFKGVDAFHPAVASEPHLPSVLRGCRDEFDGRAATYAHCCCQRITGADTRQRG